MSQPKRLTEVSELRNFASYCFEGQQQSYEELHRRLCEFHIDIDLSRFQTLDPFSDTYIKEQLEFYEELTGKRYGLANEATDVNVEESRYRPYPYGTGSKKAVGAHLAAIGKLIEHMPVDPPAKVLDMGPGWGNTTIALAQTGYQVTALDIERRFIDLINLRAQDAHVDVTAQVGAFDQAHMFGEKFDCALFFESFHHTPYHNELLANLINNCLTLDGRLHFVGEPITDHNPVPWGLRLDPMSVYSICQFGWFELGFSTDYFYEVLRRQGYECDRIQFTELTDANMFTARKQQPRSTYEPGEHFQSRQNEAHWNKPEQEVDFRFTKGFAELRVNPPVGTTRAQLKVSNFSPLDKQVVIKTDIETRDIMLEANGSQDVVIDLTETCETLSIDTDSWSPKELGLSADERELGVAVHRIELS